MMKRLLLLACAATTVLAQGRGGPANREAPVTPVPFERILRSNQEPQNWLTYSGNLNSQRHSGLTQINPENAAISFSNGSFNRAHSTSMRSLRSSSTASCIPSRAPTT